MPTDWNAARSCQFYFSGRVAGWVGGLVTLEEWKVRLTTSAKFEVEVKAELDKSQLLV